MDIGELNGAARLIACQLCALTLCVFGSAAWADQGAANQNSSSTNSIVGLRATWAPPLMRSAMHGASSLKNKPLTGGVTLAVPKQAVTGPAPSFTLGTSDSGSSIVSSGASKPLVLQGGVREDVPRTPEAVAHYLLRMKRIITEYDQVAAGILLGSGGLNTDPASIEAARIQTLSLVAAIRNIVPPDELKFTHATLATAMADVGEFLASGSQAGLMALPRALGLISQLQGSLDRYHSGCLQCINHYNLELSYDPFSGEDLATKQRMNEGLANFQQQKINELQQSGRQNPSQGADMIFGSGSGLGGSLFGDASPAGGSGGSLFGGGAESGSSGGGLGALGGLGGLGGLGSLF